ncbi:MAG: ParB N-terminal domain-containing protein [Flavobacteriaceae bacterium]|nr:ParB N-terminal domain-containing protein [Flavobacteriaceae bacterium]
MYSSPIILYVYKGKSYIIDGHHRIQAVISSDKKLEIIILNSEKAIQNFASKVDEIHKGWYK